MRRVDVLEELSRRVPALVGVALCAALLAFWVEAPSWLPYGLAAVLGGLALILMATRGRQRFRTGMDSEESDWLAHELAGNGSPSGTYLLAFFDVIAIALTGFQGAYAMPGWSALALTAAWAIANAHYPPSEEPEV